MSIVPQIALVKPNREVRQYIDPSPEAIRQAISDSNGSGQLTLQKGAYGAQKPGQGVTVPLGIDIILMPGADVSRVNFFDPDGNPFPNIFNFNNLEKISQVVNTISGGDGISVDQPTGDVTVTVPENGIVNNLLAADSVDPDVLDTNNSPSGGQVLGYNGSVMTWLTGDIETTEPISGTGTQSNPVTLDFKDSTNLNFRVNNQQLTADIRENGSINSAMIGDSQITNSELGAGSASNGNFLKYQNGITWGNVSAAGVTGGTFSGSYTFSNELSLDGGATLGSDLVIGNSKVTFSENFDTAKVGIESGEFLLSSSNINTRVKASNAGDDIILDSANDIRMLAPAGVRIKGSSSVRIDTNDSNMEGISGSNISISSEGYMDFPMIDNNDGKEPPSPPDGYIRMYAITGGSGNSAGKYKFVEPSGSSATIDIN